MVPKLCQLVGHGAHVRRPTIGERLDGAREVLRFMRVIGWGSARRPDDAQGFVDREGWHLHHLEPAAAIPQQAVQWFDAQREPSPRPHFLAQWLNHPAGTVLALLDGEERCHGFGRIRPCLLHPDSRGEVLLRSSNPRDPVKIVTNFFSAPNDLPTLRQGFKIAREVASQPPLARWRGVELAPGPKVKTDEIGRAHV